MNGARSTLSGTDANHRGLQPSVPIALRPKDAAKALGIGQRLLWQLTHDGKIPHVRLGACILYPRPVLEAWLAEKAAKAVRP